MFDVRFPATQGSWVAVVFAVFGLTLLVATTVLWPIDAAYYRVWVEEPVDGEPPAAETIDYGELPPEVRADVDDQLDGEVIADGGFRGDLQTVRELRSHTYLRYSGEYYAYETSLDCFGCLNPFVRWLRAYALAIAATTLSLAGLARLGNDPQPLTLPQTLVFPAATVTALGVAYAHDWVLGGSGQVLPLATTAGTVVPVVTLFAAAGVFARRRSRRAGVAAALPLVVACVALAGPGLPDTVSVVVFPVALLCVAALPFVALGALTARRSSATAPERTP